MKKRKNLLVLHQSRLGLLTEGILSVNVLLNTHDESKFGHE
jgi:hypothetical protein